MFDRCTIEPEDEEVIDKRISKTEFSYEWNGDFLRIVDLLSRVVFDKRFCEEGHDCLQFFIFSKLFDKFFANEIDEFFSLLFCCDLNREIRIHLIDIPSIEYIRIESSEREGEFTTQIVEDIILSHDFLVEALESTSEIRIKSYFCLEFFRIESRDK